MLHPCLNYPESIVASAPSQLLHVSEETYYLDAVHWLVSGTSRPKKDTNIWTVQSWVLVTHENMYNLESEDLPRHPVPHSSPIAGSSAAKPRHVAPIHSQQSLRCTYCVVDLNILSYFW